MIDDSTLKRHRDNDTNDDFTDSGNIIDVDEAEDVIPTCNVIGSTFSSNVTTKRTDTSVRIKSEVWVYFKVKDSENVICQCGQEYSFKKGGSTSSMRKHLVKKCSKYNSSLSASSLSDDKSTISLTSLPQSKDQRTIFMKKDDNNKLIAISGSNVIYNASISLKLLIDMIIIDELPFSIVERNGFRVFIQSLRNEFAIPGDFSYHY